MRTFLQAYRLKTSSESIAAALLRCLREANASVLRVASEPSAEGAGTTIAAAVLHDHALHWISAGDTRIYLLRGDRLTRITSDHTYGRQLDEQVAQGKISLAEAHNHSERGSLTSYLGQAEPKEVDRSARALALHSGDIVLICTDGFYRALDEAEILSASRTDLQRGCDQLVHQILAKQRKGQDNLTVIALKQSGRTRKIRPALPGTRRRRISLYVGAFAVFALFSTALGFWYEKRSTTVPQIQPQANTNSATTGGQSSSRSDKELKKDEAPAANTNPPPHNAGTKPATSAKEERKRAHHKHVSGATPKNPPSHTTTVPNQSDASGLPDAGKNTPSTDSGETQPANDSTPTAPTDQQKVNPPSPDNSPAKQSPPPVTNPDKPDGPPNMTSVSPRRDLGRKDGDPCPS